MSACADGIGDFRSDFRYEARTEVPVAEFTTAFRAGTGGHRVAVYADRIVTYRRDGRTSVLPLGDVVSVSTFEGGASQRDYGAHFVVKASQRDIAYRFDDATTRFAFLRAARLLPHGEA